MIISKAVGAPCDETLWHKRFVLIGWCSPEFWNSEVWARKKDGKWELQLTREELEFVEEQAIW